VNIGAAIEASTKPTKTVEPGVSTFNHPSEFTEPASMLGSTLRDDSFERAVAKCLTIGLGVVAAIGVNSLGLLKRSATTPAKLRLSAATTV
jgi:hypothetical protein